jgi:hypothetical protein
LMKKGVAKSATPVSHHSTSTLRKWCRRRDLNPHALRVGV